MTSTQAAKPLALHRSADAQRNEHGVYTIGRTVLGHMSEERGRVIAYTGRGYMSFTTTTEALTWLVAVANTRKVRSALTAAGHKAPTKGGYAGIEVDDRTDGAIQIGYHTRGFGSIINGTTRALELRAVRDTLIARGVPAELHADGADRYGDREIVVVHPR